MGVYIPNMEMPKNCHVCVFGRYEVCAMNLAIRGKDSPDCPLVTVPPHGDLIGRNWLIDIALHLMNTAKNDDIANGVKWLLQYIIDSPTIIPAEEEMK